MEMEKEVKILNLDDILPNRFQPRIKFNESAILELADSIKEHGVIQPIVVRKISDKYEIIAGERRYKASLLAGKTTIPAVITTLDDKKSAEIALIENVQRQDLTPIEEAISYKKILDMGYLNQTELAEKLGRTQSTIANKLRLLNLSEDVQEALLEQKISERHARSLLKLKEADQPAMLEKIINERLTVRKTDEEIKKILNGEISVINKLENPFMPNAFEIPNESIDIKIEEKALEQNDSVKNPSVEVLDLDLEGNEEEKMNQELNIPMEKIIEPIEDTTSTSNAWAMPQQPTTPVEPITPVSVDIPQASTVAPGFVDVTKIENEAQDIFKPQQAPADMNMLLQAAPQQAKVENPMAPSTPEVTPTGSAPQAPAGKFFNMTSAPTATEDLEQKQTNMDFGEPKVNNTFMFNFNPLEGQSAPAASPVVESASVAQPTLDVFGAPTQAAPATPTVETAPVVSATSIFTNPVAQTTPAAPAPANFTSLSDMTPASAPVENITPVAEPVITETPVVETAPVASVTPAPEVETPTVQPVEPVSPVVESTPTVEVAPIDAVSQPVVEPVAPVQDNIFTPNISAPVTQDNVFSPNITPQQEENTFEPFNPYSLNENNEFTQDNELDNYRIGGEAPQAAVSTSAPAVAANPTDMRAIINQVRECAKAIEASGYVVELDELDFPESYQINFKITKKGE